MMYTRPAASDYDDWETVQESQVGIEAPHSATEKGA